MLYVSKIVNEDIYVIDTDDNTETKSNENELRYALSLGLKIQGALISDNKLYLKRVNLSKISALDLAKRKLVDSIWKSANLEGLGTTFPKTESILENIPTKTSREEVFFIVNMKNAWKFLFDNLDYPINLMFLRQLNKIVGDNLFKDCGEIRSYPVSIGGTSWSPTMPIESLIYKDLVNLDLEENAELRALKYFCYIARTQMFGDGNKRVAQLVANKVLISNNIGIFQVPIDRLDTFKTLLIAYYESDNDNELIKFMLRYCIVKY